MQALVRCGVVVLSFLVLALAPCDVALAQATLVLQPDGAAGKDASITNSSPTENFGASPYMLVNYVGIDHGLIEFDLSSLPPGATVTGATLEVLENTNCQFNENAIELHLNEAAWDEATVTWNNAPVYGFPLGVNSGEAGGGCDLLIFDVTGVVQDWASGATPNYGFRVTGPDGSDVVKYVWSSDFGDPASRPVLRIAYRAAGNAIPTMTEWGGILLSALMALAAVVILARRRPPVVREA